MTGRNENVTVLSVLNRTGNTNTTC